MPSQITRIVYISPTQYIASNEFLTDLSFFTTDHVPLHVIRSVSKKNVADMKIMNGNFKDPATSHTSYSVLFKTLELFHQATITFFKEKETLTQNVEKVRSRLHEDKKRLEIMAGDMSRVQTINKPFLPVQMPSEELLKKALEIIFLLHGPLHRLLQRYQSCVGLSSATL
ncbi:hypothetical protein BGAL_0595g00010 [Botrytis galanthina]|uniref:Uncharacterized protein n=1 Tax=Botrytis galanthina TaxID=278940 RepID=A0A4S8QL88_9HELO|nr:hypothetical protein BGAL_0595g00010 [Botrytis galanthina]